MKKQDTPFWALVVSLVFGVALHWPAWLKLITILLSGTVLVQVSSRLFQAYGKQVYYVHNRTGFRNV